MNAKQRARLMKKACAKLEGQIEDGTITTAKEADEAAAEIAGEVFDFRRQPAAFEQLSARLCEIAGREFPGDWEDYPKREAA